MIKKVYPGWRYFRCKCGYHWRETCRDFRALSDLKCEKCIYPNLPYQAVRDIFLKKDAKGNLLPNYYFVEILR